MEATTNAAVNNQNTALKVNEVEQLKSATKIIFSFK